jgi:hypothetical protein
MPLHVPVHSLATLAIRAWIAFLLFASLAWPAVARAETAQCTVLDTMPATIDAPGIYCLDQDFVQVFLGDAIRINSDDVVLDCNDRMLRHNDANSLGNGITTTSGRHNVTIRHCRLDNFTTGISIETNGLLGGSEVHLLDNTITRFRVSGITAYGSTIAIEGNRITGGRADTGSGGMTGIYLASFNSDGAGSGIRNNVIADLVPQPFEENANETMAIFFGNVGNTEIAGNVISGLFARGGGHCAWGIYGSSPTGASITGNVIMPPPSPPAPPNDGSFCGGITLYGTVPQQATNVCRDNVVGHFNTPIYGCVESGNTKL